MIFNSFCQHYYQIINGWLLLYIFVGLLNDSMLKQGMHQKMFLKMSPQQIQLMKLLQIPAANLEERIKEELEANPALEEGVTEEADEKESVNSEDDVPEEPADEIPEVVNEEKLQFFKLILKLVLFFSSTYSSLGNEIEGSGSGINSLITTSYGFALY